MRGLIFVVALVISFAVGSFGFSQIIGSLQTRQKAFLLTILVWLTILVGEYFLARWLVPRYMTAFYIGSGASFVAVLLSGKIK